MSKQVQSLSISKAIDGIKLGEFVKNKKVKFNESLDIAINLVVPKDSAIRGSVKAPSGLGRKCVTAVFADNVCKDADYMISEDTIQSFFTDKLYKKCDICVAEKRYVPILAKIGAKKLGPRKLMPDLRIGTVTDDIDAAVKIFKEGVILFRGAKSNAKSQQKTLKSEKVIVHACVGKVDQSIEDLKSNIAALVATLKQVMPSKGKIISAMLSTTMGRSVRVSLEEVCL